MKIKKFLSNFFRPLFNERGQFGGASGGGGGGSLLARIQRDAGRAAQATEQSTFLPEQKISAFNQFQSFLQNPLQGIQEILGPLLDELLPSEARARGSLSDVFRKAGAQGSGAFAQASRQLEGDILRNRGQTAIRAGLSFLAPLISGHTGLLAGIPALSQSRSESVGAGVQGGGGLGAAPRGGGLGDIGDLASLLNFTGGGGGGIGFSPLNPGSSEFERLHFQRYGFLPGAAPGDIGAAGLTDSRITPLPGGPGAPVGSVPEQQFINQLLTNLT